PQPRALLSRAPERPRRDPTVSVAAPRAAPVFEAEQFLWCFPDERLDGVLIAQPIATRDGVVAVFVETVVGADDAGGAPFRRDGVAAHRVHLGHHRDAKPLGGFCEGNGGAQPGTSTADEYA